MNNYIPLQRDDGWQSMPGGAGWTRTLGSYLLRFRAEVWAVPGGWTGRICQTHFLGVALERPFVEAWRVGVWPAPTDVERKLNQLWKEKARD